MNRKLNQRQENFCLNIIQGMTQYEAYTKAGYKPETRATAIVKASQMVAKDSIKVRLEELRKPVYDEMVVSLREREAKLSEIIRLDVDFNKVSQETKLEAKLKATHLLNKQQKVYSDAPQQDNRSYTLILATPEAKLLAEKIMKGERTGLDTSKET